MKSYNLPSIHNCKVAVIGLGYVGLPLVLEINNQKYCFLTNKLNNRKILGFDINKSRINEIKDGFDRNKIFSYEEIKNIKNIKFSENKELLNDIDVFIITVPTPIDAENNPDLSFVRNASKLVGEAIKLNINNRCNQIIIYESTFYPGVTEEICVPILESNSGKIFNDEQLDSTFYCGYSPERINPGDKEHNLNSVIKVTSGCNARVASWVDEFYGSFIKAGTFKTSSIKVAEAAKIIENTQRDINIALVNELSMLFKKVDIDTQEVLSAASTKWNFHKYKPGLVGGHCIGVDPYYLTYMARKISFNTRLISAGRVINDYMYQHLSQLILKEIEKQKEDSGNINILILGLSYKSNCSDVRNSQLIKLIKSIKIKNIKFTIVDPQIDQEQVFNDTGLKSYKSIPKNQKFRIIIFALYHEEFKNLSKQVLNKYSYKNTIIFDLNNKIIGSNVIHF